MLDLFTIIWGKEMTETFLEVCLPSLLQPENIPASRGLLHTYQFYATDEAKETITQNELYQRLTKELEVNWLPLQKGEWETTSDTLHQMQLGAAERHYALIMAPDNCVGNGSILNMAQLCDGSYNPILFGFPRVNDEGFQKLEEMIGAGQSISNRQLVTVAMAHIEQTTYPIEQGVPRQWIVHGNSWKVRHNVPTPCVLPDERLINFFATNPTKNSGYDHIVPYWMVEMGYPWHLIRDSDVFFLIERGRHIIIEGSGQDIATWDQFRALKGLEFFEKEEAIWQGV